MDIGKQQRVIMVTPLEASEESRVAVDVTAGEDAPSAEPVREGPAPPDAPSPPGAGDRPGAHSGVATREPSSRS